MNYIRPITLYQHFDNTEPVLQSGPDSNQSFDHDYRLSGKVHSSACRMSCVEFIYDYDVTVGFEPINRQTDRSYTSRIFDNREEAGMKSISYQGATMIS
jgi:hypothetical protein